MCDVSNLLVCFVCCNAACVTQTLCLAAAAGGRRQWDVAYVSQKVKEARYKFNEEELRPFFSLPRVLEVRVGIAQAGRQPRPR